MRSSGQPMTRFSFLKILFFVVLHLPLAVNFVSAKENLSPSTEIHKKKSDSFSLKRQTMVDHQIQARGVKDPQVLLAMRNVKRHLFVDPGYEDIAYQDSPLPIAEGQTISQPYIVAFMTEALHLTKEDRVLEIGTGSGYQAAILGEIAKEVYTIELLSSLARDSEKKLKALNYHNIHVRQGDGYQGWPEHAPYDAIIVTAAPPKIPTALVDQLKVGGRMILPLGSFFQELYIITRTDKGIEKERLFPVRFVPMVSSKKTS